MKRPSICKECGLSVQWSRASGSGKWQCHNAGTTTDHWDLCSKTKFERIKRTGEPFESKLEAGYYTEFKPSGVQFTRQSSGAIRGDRFTHSEKCEQCCPPWEVCMKCPDKLERAA